MTNRFIPFSFFGQNTRIGDFGTYAIVYAYTLGIRRPPTNVYYILEIAVHVADT
jgi:hypothetical protein